VWGPGYLSLIVPANIGNKLIKTRNAFPGGS
jgi:hypothetical protein